MSTRSLVGTITKTGKYAGRYVHSDGYPHGRIPALVEIIARHDGNLRYVIETLTKTHSEWRSLGYGGNVEGFGDTFEDEQGGPLWRGSLHEDNDDFDIEWGYFFTSRDESKAELVITQRHRASERDIHDSYRQVERARIKVTELHKLTERDIRVIECGEHFERCIHVAEYHFPQINLFHARMATGKVLGAVALDPVADATHATWKGTRYELAWGGHDGGPWGGKPGLYYRTGVDEFGHRADIAIARTNSKSRPGQKIILPSVTLEYPELPDAEELLASAS